jgi:hypothetical protein
VLVVSFVLVDVPVPVTEPVVTAALVLAPVLVVSFPLVFVLMPDVEDAEVMEDVGEVEDAAAEEVMVVRNPP